MKLQVVDLSRESLEGIGHMLTPETWTAPGTGQEYSYIDTDTDLGLPSPISTGALESVPRPMVLGRMERHLRTREALIALEGDAVLCLAPPQESVNGELVRITAVRMRAGQAIIMNTGAWHWIPFPIGRKSVRFLVVFRSGTGKDDLHYHDFAQGIPVRL
jgi:ureidoglycolate hydrolase